MSEIGTARTERLDFRATSDPALLESADRGEVNLLTYRQLYELWERQHWAVQDIDFTQDRIDWHERISGPSSDVTRCSPTKKLDRQQRVTSELGPLMRAV